MNIQYISNEKGETSGVFIPITEWNELKAKYAELRDEYEIPEWQKQEARERLERYEKSPKSAQSFDSAIDEIEDEL